jgi:hypothetical protein
VIQLANSVSTGDDHFLQCRKVPIVQTTPTRKFPDALDGIQVWAVRWQKVEAKTLPLLASPVSMESGMMIGGIIRDDHDTPAGVSTGTAKIFQELEAGGSVKTTRLALKEEPPIAHSHGAEVTDATPGGVVEQHRVFDFGRDPHAAARAVLLEMHLVHSPKVHLRIGA